MGDLTNDFSKYEISCHCGCGEDRISKDLMARIQVVRTVVNRPLTVTSGCRCIEYNRAEGGVDDSEHVPSDTRPGDAIDIECKNSRLRFALIKVGVLLFQRIGEGNGFLHFGIRPDKPQEVLWNYYKD